MAAKLAGNGGGGALCDPPERGHQRHAVRRYPAGAADHLHGRRADGDDLDQARHAAGQGQGTPTKPVLVSIQDSGALFLAGQPTSLKTLGQDLNASFAANGQTGPRKDQRLMVSAQADVPYEALMGVINRVHTEGWTQIGIINEDIR
jgi:biopolymer transport protein ExbD